MAVPDLSVITEDDWDYYENECLRFDKSGKRTDPLIVEEVSEKAKELPLVDLFNLYCTVSTGKESQTLLAEKPYLKSFMPQKKDYGIPHHILTQQLVHLSYIKSHFEKGSDGGIGAMK